MLQRGDVFLTKEDKRRIKLQTAWEKLYNSELIHQIVIDKTGTSRAVDPLIPLPNTISEIFADLLFLKFPIIKFDNEALVETLRPVINKLKIDLLEAAGLNSATGMLFWVLFKKDGNTFWKFKSPTKVQWEKDELGQLIMVRFFSAIETKGEDQRFFIREYNLIELGKKENISKRAILEEYEIVITIATQEVKMVDGFVSTDTGLDFIPVIEIQNIGQLNSPIGKSDYQGKEQLFAEIDNRVDQNNNVLQEQSEPWVGVPAGVLDEGGNFNRQNGKWFEKTMSGAQGDNEVDVVTWDASMNASFEQIKMMIRQVLFTSRISSPIAGFEEGNQVESGTALKWRSINTFSSLGRRRIYWGEAIRTFFLYYSKMTEGVPDLKDMTDSMVIDWQESIPMDEQALTQNIVQRTGAQVMSKLAAIKKANEFDQKKAQEELDQIQKEQGDDADIQSRQFTGGVTL